MKFQLLWYKLCLAKTTKLSIICNKSSKMWFPTNVCDISSINIKVVGIWCYFHHTYEIIWNSNYFEINYVLKKKTTKSSIICNKSSNMWFQTNICRISFIYIKIVGISKLTGSPPRGFWEVAILNKSYCMKSYDLIGILLSLLWCIACYWQ
jgi:hypothetical protein